MTDQNEKDDQEERDENEDAGKGLLTEEKPAGGLSQRQFKHKGRNPDVDAEDEEDDEEED